MMIFGKNEARERAEAPDKTPKLKMETMDINAQNKQRNLPSSCYTTSFVASKCNIYVSFC